MTVRYEDYTGQEVPVEQARVMRDTGVHQLSQQSLRALEQAKQRYDAQLARHIKRVS